MKDNLGIKNVTFGEKRDFSRTEIWFGIFYWPILILKLYCRFTVNVISVLYSYVYFYKYQILIFKEEIRSGV